MKEQTAETIIGALVAVAAAGFLTFAVARAGVGEAAGGYPLKARFNRVDGVAVGSDVRMSGVKVGAVSQIALDPKSYMAQLTFSVDQAVQVPEDSVAKIANDGLLGGAYVAIDAGGSTEMLKPSGEIAQTQGTVDLLTVLASAAANVGNANNGATPNNGANPNNGASKPKSKAGASGKDQVP